MNYFTANNTEGFTQEVLDMMNDEFKNESLGLDESIFKSIGDQIFNKYC